MGVALAAMTVLAGGLWDGAAWAAPEWRWSATFAKTKANHILSLEKDWNTFHKRWLDLQKKGFELVDIEVQSNVLRYSGVFKKSKSKGASKLGVSLSVIKKDFGAWTKKGYRMVDFETWTDGKKNLFGALYLKGSGRSGFWVENNWNRFLSKWKEFEKSGLRMIDFETWYRGDTQWFAGVFKGGTYPAGSIMGVSSSQFFKTRDEFKAKGYRLIDFEVATRGSEVRYYGLFGKTGADQLLRVNDSKAGFFKKRSEFKKSGYKIDDLEVAWIGAVGKPAQSKPEPPKSKPIYVSFKGNTKRDSRTGLLFPDDMPSIHWPKGYNSCSSAEKDRINKAWAMAHFMMWRADQIMDWLGRNDRNRKQAWSWGYRGRNEAQNYANYSPRAWFGPYDGKRFRVAHSGVNKAWSDHFRGKTFTVKCRVRGGKTGAHPCFQNNPGTGRTPTANHIVKRTVNFCDSFFAPRWTGDNEKDIWQIFAKARTVVHELFHHVRLRDGNYVLDTHVHCDNGRCKTEKMYGRAKATHLSHVRGVNAGHYKRALRNNDNYAYFAYYVGVVAYYDKPLAGDMKGFGHLTQWPPKGYKYK